MTLSKLGVKSSPAFFFNISKITQAFVKKSRKVKITQVHATPRALNEREVVNGSSELDPHFNPLKIYAENLAVVSTTEPIPITPFVNQN